MHSAIVFKLGQNVGWNELTITDNFKSIAETNSNDANEGRR